MQPGQPHNMVIVEITEPNGEVGRITGQAMTENDDAIQVIVDLMAQENISDERVLRLYSERKPSPRWYEYFAQHWPQAEVTWSFGPGDDAKMEAAVSKLLKGKRPWWKFW